MAFQMMLWANQAGNLVELATQQLDQEERLEDWIVQNPSLLGMEILIIGRQVSTPSGGRIDLLAIDEEGDLVILELKRGRTPREVVAQILDYASWVNQLEPPEIVALAHRYLNRDLSIAFSEKFDTELPEVINADHRMIIVASELDDSSERIVQYLSSRHSLNINVVFFTCFKLAGNELIGRAWLIDPEEVEERSEARRKTPWSGHWFVNVGEGPHRNWDDCRKYGFLSAGNGTKYSDPLKKLKIGDKVFAYMKKVGYVGFGEITGLATMAKDFVPEGATENFFDLPLSQPAIKHDPDDPIMADWVVGVKWKKTFSRDEGQRFPNIFANQNIVCKLRHDKTIDFLKRQFGITE